MIERSLGIWYHGSPRDFNTFEFGHECVSRVLSGKINSSIFLIKDKEFASKLFGKNGYLYTVLVDLKFNSLCREYEIYNIEGNNGKPCLEIFDLSELTIIDKQKTS